jgi:1-acyl-sn-glycerol-3-phosphate acyltransferase
LKLRGLLTIGFIGAGLIVADPFQRIVIAGLAKLMPTKRTAILSWWERRLAHFVIGSCRHLGGVHIGPPPTLPGREGVLVLMNHQSLLDIPLVVAALRPAHPRIVTRARYAGGKPLISHMVRLYQYPLVDGRANARAQIGAIADNARTSPVPLVIFPEGHRTRDGEIGPWKEGGLRAILGARRWSVYVMVADGYWKTARLVDFLEQISSIDGHSLALGPFEGPEPGTDPEPFIAEMRARMVEALHTLRASGRTA